jgi:hypothetical protein
MLASLLRYLILKSYISYIILLFIKVSSSVCSPVTSKSLFNKCSDDSLILPNFFSKSIKQIMEYNEILKLFLLSKELRIRSFYTLFDILRYSCQFFDIFDSFGLFFIFSLYLLLIFI